MAFNHYLSVVWYKRDTCMVRYRWPTTVSWMALQVEDAGCKFCGLWWLFAHCVSSSGLIPETTCIGIPDMHTEDYGWKVYTTVFELECMMTGKPCLSMHIRLIHQQYILVNNRWIPSRNKQYIFINVIKWISVCQVGRARLIDEHDVKISGPLVCVKSQTDQRTLFCGASQN